MSSTPLMASSRGVATALATTSAFAPGYNAVTCTVGGAMSGNNVMGSVNRDINPSRVSNIETTVDKTGLSMNILSIIVLLRQQKVQAPAPVCPGLVLSGNRTPVLLCDDQISDVNFD